MTINSAKQKKKTILKLIEYDFGRQLRTYKFESIILNLFNFTKKNLFIFFKKY
jgi:hypothetical protein